jgi:hypothetical protein
VGEDDEFAFLGVSGGRGRRGGGERGERVERGSESASSEFQDRCYEMGRI